MIRLRLRMRGCIVVKVAPNHHAAIVDRKRSQILDKLVERALPLKIELDVRNIERRYVFFDLRDVLADRLNGLRTGKVADNRHDHILVLELLEKLKLFL